MPNSLTPQRVGRRAAAVTALACAALLVGGCATVASAPGAGTAPPAAATTSPETRAIAEAAARVATQPPAVPAPPAAASAPGAARGASPAAVAAAAAAQAAAQAAQGAKPFADVVKDANESSGLFRLWTRDEKAWLEIGPEQFDRPFFLTASLNQGIGERRLYGGMMTYPAGFAHLIEFRRVGQLVQIVAKNVKYTAAAGTPEARAVAAGFSDSLIATAAIVSLPHPDRKSVLIDVNAVFVADLPAGALVLERIYRQPYAFDARNSSLVRSKATADLLTFEVNAHYALARPLTPPPGGGSPGLTPSLPGTLPDPRSLFLGYHYTLAALPAEPMAPRLADERIGFFTTERLDFTHDTERVPVTRYANRWRLEKKDPAVELSEPKRPITFWLDRNIPEKYRAPIRAGILEWNKAFERIGFREAIRVLQQPDDADFDTADLGHASVRWQIAARSSFGAIGPSIVDPRSGEILDADIAIDANNLRTIRNLRTEFVPGASAAPAAARTDPLACAYDEVATGEAVFGLALLEARGALAPDGTDADAFVAAVLKDVTMHEVGHTLGLRHNFRASTVYTEAQLADPEFTRTHGISGSVMEYNPWNIALRGAAQGAYVMSTLGPYDYWAIEYGYRPLPAGEEAAALAAIAGRSNEPLLAYATDDHDSYFALDPQINQLDLGQDPLAFARKRFTLVRELWQRTEAKALAPGESYSQLRRNFSRGLGEAGQGAVYAAKYIGGLTTLRDRAGSGRDPLSPVPVAKQREALQLIATEVFAAEAFSFPPAFLRRLSVSSFDMDDAWELGRAPPAVDVAVDQQVLAMQRTVLNQLMGETVAQRLVNNEAKVDDPRQALRLSELYATLHAAVWSELRTGQDIPLLRRNLQREYVARVAATVLRPAASLPADARALLRADAVRLRAEIRTVQSNRTLSPEAQAHLAEAAATLDEVLKAPLLRPAV